MSDRFEILIWREGEWWVARHGDIVAQARSPEDAAYDVQRMVVGAALVEGREIPGALADRWRTVSPPKDERPAEACVTFEITPPTAEEVAQTARHVVSRLAFTLTPPIATRPLFTLPDDDEYLSDYAPPLRLDMREAERWMYRARRSVYFVDDGRRILVWKKGAAVPDDEARRQGVEWYMEPCARCEGLGNHLNPARERVTCSACNGDGKLRRRAPWAGDAPA